MKRVTQHDHTHKWLIIAASILGFVILVLCGMLMFFHAHHKPIEKNDCGEYQLIIAGQDSLQVWDGSRHVGTIFFTDDSEIGNLLMYDNQ